MSKKVLPQLLIVDDDPNVITDLTRHLRKYFRIYSALSGKEGLALLKEHGPTPVVMSNMRMPEMTGAVFLSKVREAYPDTVRVLLTGQSDMESAIAAINEGQIFRFLTKPCPPDTLRSALQSAAKQYELVTSEKVLLEKTLKGSIKTLTDILSLVLPEAFGRASRIKEHAVQISSILNVENAWQIEVAAMLSQIGAVVLDPETSAKMYLGETLTKTESENVEKLPIVAADLLHNIPRLEQVCAIIRRQSKKRFELGNEKGDDKAVIQGAQILKVVIDFDHLMSRGLNEDNALEALNSHANWYDEQVLQVFGEQVLGKDLQEKLIKEIPVTQIMQGMVLAEDVKTPSGTLLVAKGFRATKGLVERLRNLHSKMGEKKTVCVIVDH